MMNCNNKEFDKEEVRNIVEERPWRDISYEWHIGTNSDLYIYKTEGGAFLVSTACGTCNFGDEFTNFDDAWAGLDRLHEFMIRYASPMHLWIPSLKLDPDVVVHETHRNPRTCYRLPEGL